MTTIPTLRLDGLIAARGEGRGGGLSAQGLERPLQRAFEIKAPAVALIVNSPGGSPTQSALIGRRIRRLAEQKRRRVLAFVEDVAASGGYWLACAADEIFALETSVLGSIGVIGGGFGFPEALRKLGVERRVYAAGRAKAQLDPFQPENPEDVARMKRLLAQIHEAFIAHVRASRGARLKPDPRLFEAEIFLGQEALALGLIDGLGDIHSVVKERFGKGAKLRAVPVAKGGLLRRLAGGLAEDAISAIETRAAFARFGL